MTLQPTEVFSGDVLEFGTEVSGPKVGIGSGFSYLLRANTRLSGADGIQYDPATEDPSEIIPTWWSGSRAEGG